MKNILILILWGMLVSCSEKNAEMRSPSGKITASVFTEADRTLAYTVSLNGRMINDTSAMGLTVDGQDLFRNVSLKQKQVREIRETYPVRGGHREAANACNEYVWEVEREGNSYTLEIRLYDDGVAYRFILPGDGERRIEREVAQWRLPVDSRVWFAERLSDWKLMTYAGEWISCPASDLSSISQQGPIQIMPLLFEIKPENYYALISEAALYNYSGMRLRASADGSLDADFTEKDGFVILGDIRTPWRVLLLAENLNQLVNSDIITNLNPAPDKELFADETWIRPGRSLWSWWSEIDGVYMTLQGEKAVIDAAGELGFEYSTVDEGWERASDKWKFAGELAEYGDTKNVGIFLWKHWKEINDTTADYRVMTHFFDSVALCGAKGLKIDFMNGEGLQQIHFEEKALQLAARRKLMINFHGCQKPSGESRTYPNEVTREGVRGIELNRITAYYEKKIQEQGKDIAARKYIPGGENQNIPATHNVTLPFTRCVTGAADYTPVAFSRPGNTTAVHQVASAYVITSPLQCIAENPFLLLEDRKLNPALQFIKELPAVWDETIVLPQSKIGKTAAFARRAGDKWFLAVINTEPGQLRFQADFLPKGEYTMTLLEDSRQEDHLFTVSKAKIKSSDSFPVTLSENGGAVAIFEKTEH